MKGIARILGFVGAERQRTRPPDERCEMFVVDEERRLVSRGGEN
jgi:hypothetical protein